MTLSELEIGRIQGEVMARKRNGPVNVRALSRKFGRAQATIVMALNYKRGSRGVYKKRKVALIIKKRRRVVTRLATQTEVKDGRVYPVNCTANEIAASLGGSVRAVRRDLKACGFTCHVRKKVPSRDPKVIQSRLDFTTFWNRPAQRHNHARVVFSDEHTVSLNDHGSRTMYVRFHKDPLLPRERRKHKCIARVMIWAACGIGFKSDIVIFPQTNVEEDNRKKEKMSYRLHVDSYIRRCLSKVVPALSAGWSRIFQHDNASPHGRGSLNSRVYLYLNRKGIEVMINWPAHSPDLNMIEYVWPILNKRVSALKPTNLEELIAAVKQGWASITQAEIDAQCAYFSQRVEDVFVAKGVYP